jgi:hypothetical protein
MRVDQYGSVGGGPSGAVAEVPPVPGRVDVAERALRAASLQAVSELVGVGRGDVSVDVREFRGGYALRVSTPLPIPDLDDPAAVEAAPRLLERMRTMQEDLSVRLGDLLGRPVVRVDITVTGARAPERKRVR